ncbi:LacI family DNA-binding transcriptional regulator [Phytomonospora endophytica]|uniref:LacI family transcriptional regulator n=1 Tax=Phytomonospora endophytica TaxID=714109 RepID=A0A841FPA8_9ACTN|nr:LacI family DNA-binding transcriptional regulator [Phytomonospora endophytica]MBB6035077.1 LacI family transcriptional regulator [Phytomonospora endophytica]GIG64174.1 LacI family transcriptional regulator [Phytomonospora endophytica]
MDEEERDGDARPAMKRRPTVYQVAEKAGVSIATVSRALRGDGSVAAATRQRVLDAAEELAREQDEAATGGRRRPTVYQVAEKAGVSIATVSRALRDDGAVTAKTRQRVLDAVAELNWSPSRTAMALAGVANDTVAIVFPDLSGPYYANVIAGFESEVVDRGSAVMVLATHGRAASAQMVRDLSTRVDGLVIMDQTIPDKVVGEIAADVPVVLLARPSLPGVASVRTENADSAHKITRHVLGHARRRLRFLGDPDLSPDVRDRWLGFVRAHEDFELPAPEPLRAEGLAPEHGYDAALPILTDNGVDAIVCANDELASGVYRAAAEAGRSIPDEVAVTGWDDVNIALHLSPRLTTVRQPLRSLGATAGRLLFGQMESGTAQGEVLVTEMVIRESCGCEDVPPFYEFPTG